MSSAAGLVQIFQFTEANFRSQEIILRRTSGNHIFTRKKGTEVRFIWETNDVHVSALRRKGEKRRTENMLREIS